MIPKGRAEGGRRFFSYADFAEKKINKHKVSMFRAGALYISVYIYSIAGRSLFVSRVHVIGNEIFPSELHFFEFSIFGFLLRREYVWMYDSETKEATACVPYHTFT